MYWVTLEFLGKIQFRHNELSFLCFWICFTSTFLRTLEQSLPCNSADSALCPVEAVPCLILMQILGPSRFSVPPPRQRPLRLFPPTRSQGSLSGAWGLTDFPTLLQQLNAFLCMTEGSRRGVKIHVYDLPWVWLSCLLLCPNLSYELSVEASVKELGNECQFNLVLQTSGAPSLSH